MIDWKWEEDVIEFLKLRLVDLVLSNYWQALHVMQIIITFDVFRSRTKDSNLRDVQIVRKLVDNRNLHNETLFTCFKMTIITRNFPKLLKPFENERLIPLSSPSSRPVE